MGDRNDGKPRVGSYANVYVLHGRSEIVQWWDDREGALYGSRRPVESGLHTMSLNSRVRIVSLKPKQGDRVRRPFTFR